MKICKIVVSITCLSFACVASSQVSQPVAQQSVASVAVPSAQIQAEQLRAKAAQLQAQAAQLLAQAQAMQPQMPTVQVQTGQVQVAPVQPTNPLAGLITMADAKRIAFTAAGVSETDARNVKVELDSKGVLLIYEVEFNSGLHEYEYKIDARSGAVVGSKKKVDIF